MTGSASMRAHIVRVIREEGKTGLFYATSPDLKGLLVAEPTLDALERAIPQAITDLFAACGVKVVVSRVEDGLDQMRSWVAFPAELAQLELTKAERSRVE